MYKVLLVDDDAAVLKMLRMLFQVRDFEVTTASSAQEAITKLDDASFDLVVTDMRMETTTAGFDVVHSAKTALNRPTIVILSAFPLRATEWRSSGADAMFTKGGNFFEMIEEIERMLKSHRRQKTAS